MPLYGWENWPEALSPLASFGPYRCKVIRWIDGDTFYAIDDYGKRRMAEESYRLFDFDAPELFSGSIDERRAGAKAKDYAESLLPAGCFCVCITQKDKRSFNRYLADVFIMHEGKVTNLVPLLLKEQDRTQNWRLDG